MNSARSKHRVIVVEDDRTSRRLLTHILEQANYDAIESPEGRDALHFAEMNPPRAMIIDIMLPDMQGQEVVRELMHDKRFRFTKFLFLTGILSKKDSTKSYFLTIDGKRFRALPKPVRKGQLLKHLANAVNLSLEEELLEKKALQQKEETPEPQNEEIEEEQESEDEAPVSLL